MKLLIGLIIICSLQIANAKDIVLTSTNHCSLEDEVNYQSMKDLTFCLADKVIKRNGKNYTIYLVINSPGGSIYDGLKFIAFAKTIKNLETVTIFAASMASSIVESLPGKRHGVENAITMFHRAKGSVSGQFEDGELESRLALWKSIVRKMEQVNAKRIGITLKQYKRNVVNEWWVYGDDNVSENVLDQITVVKCSSKLLKDKKTRKVSTPFGSYDETISNCPLVN